MHLDILPVIWRRLAFPTSISHKCSLSLLATWAWGVSCSSMPVILYTLSTASADPFTSIPRKIVAFVYTHVQCTLSMGCVYTNVQPHSTGTQLRQTRPSPIYKGVPAPDYPWPTRYIGKLPTRKRNHTLHVTPPLMHMHIYMRMSMHVRAHGTHLPAVRIIPRVLNTSTNMYTMYMYGQK